MENTTKSTPNCLDPYSIHFIVYSVNYFLEGEVYIN